MGLNCIQKIRYRKFENLKQIQINLNACVQNLRATRENKADILMFYTRYDF